MYETTGPEQKRPHNFQEEADAKMLFHVGHLVARNNAAVRTTDTDIIALANIEKLPAVQMFGFKWDFTRISHSDM